MSTHKQSPRFTPITIRALGDNITLTREQWRQLADMLDPESDFDKRDAVEFAARIRERVSRDA